MNEHNPTSDKFSDADSETMQHADVPHDDLTRNDDDHQSEPAALDPMVVDPMVVDPMVSESRAIRPHGIEAGRTLAAAAARVAIENKGQNVVVLDVCKQSAEFDFFVLATGTSRRQLHAISEEIDDVLQKELGDRRRGIEGYEESRWIVLDYGSVVVHLFDDETREFYDLESLWADGEVIPLESLGLTPNPQ